MERESTGLQSVERGFLLLERLATRPEGFTLKEIATEMRLAKSTAHRLLGTLVGLGYARQADAAGRYRATFKMFEVGSGIVAGMDVVSIAKSHLDRLSAEMGEAVHLVVPDGPDIVYVYKADASSMRISSRVGLRRPMYCTAVGKAIMAGLPYNRVLGIWGASIVEQLTPRTITQFDELEKQLAAVKRRGWAVDDEENELGIRCVATAIPAPGGGISAAFSVTGLTAQMDDGRMEQIAARCLQVRASILAEMGMV